MPIPVNAPEVSDYEASMLLDQLGFDESDSIEDNPMYQTKKMTKQEMDLKDKQRTEMLKNESTESKKKGSAPSNAQG